MKTIVITGGSKGIGKAIALRFAKEGYGVIVCARNEAGLSQLETEVKTSYPNASIKTFKADMSKKEQVQSFASFIQSQTDRLDILVNNAGFFIPGSIDEETDGTLEITMETNVYSAYYLTKAVLPIFKEQQNGHIFNLCSTASIMPYVNGGSYCISKFAMLGMSKVLREELKPSGIKVTSILPGATKTASWEGTELPDDRFMQPSDVAEVVWSSAHLSASAVIEEVVLRPLPGDI